MGAVVALYTLCGVYLLDGPHKSYAATQTSFAKPTASASVKTPAFVADCPRSMAGNCFLNIHGIGVEFRTMGDYTLAEKKFKAIKPLETYKGKSIRPDLNRAAMLASVVTPFPYSYWVKEMYLESTLGEDTFNEESGACSAFQLLPGTMLESLYRIGKSEKYPYLREASYVERVVTKDKKYEYKVSKKSGLNKSSLIKRICVDPVKSALVSAENKSRYMPSLMKVFSPHYMPDTAIYTLHFFGGSATDSFYKGIKRSPNYPALEMYKEPRRVTNMQTNAAIFYHDKKAKNPRSFMDVWTYFHGKFQTEIVSLGHEIPAISIHEIKDKAPEAQQIASLD